MMPLGRVLDDNPYNTDNEQVKAAQAEKRNAEGRMKQLDQVGWDSNTPLVHNKHLCHEDIHILKRHLA